MSDSSEFHPGLSSNGTNGSSAATASVSIEVIAEGKENPQLWLEKYNFYISELGLNQTDAMRWADNAVRVNAEARRAYKLTMHASPR